MPDDSIALATAGAQLFPLLRAHGIEPLEYHGQPAFLPRQVATVLGYSEPRYMTDWLARHASTAEGTHWATITGSELAAVKEARIADLVGGRNSPRETLLLLPGLTVVLAEAERAAKADVGIAFRAWLAGIVRPAFVVATQPAAPVAPRQLAAPPAEVMLTLAREGTRPGDVFATSYLAAELARSRAKDRADREARRAAEQADRAAAHRLREADRHARCTKKARPTTLW